MIGPRIGPRIGETVTIDVSFIGASNPTFAIPDDSVELTFATPDGTRTGDVMIIFVATDAGAPATPESLPTGWTQIALLHADSEIVLFVFRRIANGEDPSTHVIQMSGGAVSVGSAMVVYRGLNTLSDLIDSGITDCDPSGLPTNNFPCPSLTIEALTNLYLGCVWTIDGNPAIANPPETTEILEFSQISNSFDPVDRSFEIFEFIPGEIGATGNKRSTTDSPHVGIASSILLKALHE